eukprot:CAMPEP_0197074226 /NCGR_PEP_ID=MMETSP1384-20130603/211005_1 /TAXON_ID=29189 /ORGANISM="Ammonia sp." /LENGTH=254 /DNA_ID=CAMNT_0042513067 /DNA_START=411 /DNA_END=1175 /DNA_ORIENTATION=+
MGNICSCCDFEPSDKDIRKSRRKQAQSEWHKQFEEQKRLHLRMERELGLDVSEDLARLERIQRLHERIESHLKEQGIELPPPPAHTKPTGGKTEAEDRMLSAIPIDFSFDQLKKLNEKRYYQQRREQNHGFVTIHDVIWRPKLEYKTTRGRDILQCLANNTAIQQLVKQRCWDIAALKEVDAERITDTSHCLGYNEVGQVDHSSAGIAMVVADRTDRDVFCTFTHELAHMVTDAHNGYFYQEQRKIIQFILANN